jgi:hypothetical protein
VRRGHPKPVRWASPPDSEFFFQVSLELLRDRVLIDDADSLELEAVEDSHVDFDGHAILPQVHVAALIQTKSRCNNLVLYTDIGKVLKSGKSGKLCQLRTLIIIKSFIFISLCYKKFNNVFNNIRQIRANLLGDELFQVAHKK